METKRKECSSDRELELPPPAAKRQKLDVAGDVDTSDAVNQKLELTDSEATGEKKQEGLNYKSIAEQLKRNVFAAYPQDAPAIGLVFAYRGSVYGGYLRDLVAQQEPKDIDVVIPRDWFDGFFLDMTDLGYKSTHHAENRTLIFTKPPSATYSSASATPPHPIEVYTLEEDPDTTFIGPVAAPDFDCNLLAYDGVTLFNWADVDPHRIDHLLAGIHSRSTVQCSSDEQLAPGRKEKIVARGYQISDMIKEL